MNSLIVKLWSRINLSACSHEPLPPHRCLGCGKKSRRFCRNKTQSQKGRGGSGREWQVQIQDQEKQEERVWQEGIGGNTGIGVWKKQEQ